MNKFWNFTKAEPETGTRELRLDGEIAEETWWGDEVTPELFREELKADKGDIVVWINSPGGDCVAASMIYAMLKEYPGNVTVKIDGLAASAASVIAMAGTTVSMAPSAMMMIHNPLTFAIGDADEMIKAAEVLNEFKESIINAYELKTGLSRAKISHMMDAETWMSAGKAVELGFADEMLYQTDTERSDNIYAFSRKAVTNSLINKIKTTQSTKEPSQTVPVAQLKRRLDLIKLK